MAAGAAITVVTDDVSPTVIAACAFGSALASSLTTRLHPAQSARHLRAESIHWIEVSDEADHLKRLLNGNTHSLSLEQVERRLQRLQKHRNDVLRSAVPGESLWFRDAPVDQTRCSAPDPAT
jgi:hypothetical protein